MNNNSEIREQIIASNDFKSLADSIHSEIEKALKPRIGDNSHDVKNSDHAPVWDTNSCFEFGWGCVCCGYEASEGEANVLNYIAKFRAKEKENDTI